MRVRQTCQQDIIVDGLGHTNDRALNASLLASLLDGIGCGIATIASNDKEHVDSPEIQALHN